MLSFLTFGAFEADSSLIYRQKISKIYSISIFLIKFEEGLNNCSTNVFVFYFKPNLYLYFILMIDLSQPRNTTRKFMCTFGEPGFINEQVSNYFRLTEPIYDLCRLMKKTNCRNFQEFFDYPYTNYKRTFPKTKPLIDHYRLPLFTQSGQKFIETDEIEIMKLRIHRILLTNNQILHSMVNSEVISIERKVKMYFEAYSKFSELFPELSSKIFKFVYNQQIDEDQQQLTSYFQISDKIISKIIEEYLSFEEREPHWIQNREIIEEGNSQEDLKNRQVIKYIFQILGAMNSKSEIIVREIGEKIYEFHYEKQLNDDERVEKTVASLKRRVYDCLSVFKSLQIVKKCQGSPIHLHPLFIQAKQRKLLLNKMRQTIEEQIRNIIKSLQRKQVELQLAREYRKIMQKVVKYNKTKGVTVMDLEEDQCVKFPLKICYIKRSQMPLELTKGQIMKAASQFTLKDTAKLIQYMIHNKSIEQNQQISIDLQDINPAKARIRKHKIIKDRKSRRKMRLDRGRTRK